MAKTAFDYLHQSPLQPEAAVVTRSVIHRLLIARCVFPGFAYSIYEAIQLLLMLRLLPPIAHALNPVHAYTPRRFFVWRNAV